MDDIFITAMLAGLGLLDEELLARLDDEMLGSLIENLDAALTLAHDELDTRSRQP